MPDLPTPQDDTEAALFPEYWDAVLSYADLCTSGSAAAHRLATEAFALGLREVGAAARTGVHAAGLPHARQRAQAGPPPPARQPSIPALLTAVRDTAAAWEADGRGQRLDPGLRLWLHSEGAARFAGPPPRRPVALRGLRDLPETDAALLWLAEVEALPLPTAARRLGLDPATVAGELEQVRALFRDRCHRAHLESPLDPGCRGYARLLDAVTRSPAAEAPADLSRHLDTCAGCAEAAACLRPRGGGLPAALADGVIGWGGHAYLERRRRATRVRLGVGVPDARRAAPTGPEEDAGGGRVLRGGLLATAVLLSVLALGVSMMPFDGSGGDTAAAHDDRWPVADPDAPRTKARPTRGDVPAAPPSATAPPAATATASAPATATVPVPARKGPGPEADPGLDSEPEGTSTTRRADPARPPFTARTAGCRVAYHLDSQWPEGFQATVTVTTDRALSGWQVSWTFRDGQRAGRAWDASVRQDGSRVTATAVDYNGTVAAHTALTFGFLGTRREGNRPPDDFRLNGTPCATG